MKNKILVFGKGFIGQRIRDSLGAAGSEKRIRSFEDTDTEIDKFRPGIIINAIGFTGKNVDQCEDDIDSALCANTFVPVMLLEAALRRKIKLIHISSGCIYNYNYKKGVPITENMAPDFFNLFYSRSKIYSEKALDALSGAFGILILRPRIPLDNAAHPKNILDKLLKYKRVINLPNSVTYIPDFLKALKHLIRINARGIYNVVNKGALRYPQLLDVYKKYVPGFKYETVDFKKLNMVRTNLILSTRKLEKSGFKVRPIQEVLEECVRGYLGY